MINPFKNKGIELLLQSYHYKGGISMMPITIGYDSEQLGTALHDAGLSVMGLNAGANDYITNFTVFFIIGTMHFGYEGDEILGFHLLNYQSCLRNSASEIIPAMGII